MKEGEVEKAVKETRRTYADHSRVRMPSIGTWDQFTGSSYIHGRDQEKNSKRQTPTGKNPHRPCR